jgi:hypothetical protein
MSDRKRKLGERESKSVEGKDKDEIGNSEEEVGGSQVIEKKFKQEMTEHRKIEIKKNRRKKKENMKKW